MSEAPAIAATYVEWKMIKTRKVLQLVFELPLEQQQDVLMKLGAPRPDRDDWYGIVPLQKPPTATAIPQKDLARSEAGKQRYAESDDMERARTRSAMLPNDPQFQAWCKRQTPETAAEFIRSACGVGSRREIAFEQSAYEAFLQLETEFAEAAGRLAEQRG